MYMATIHDSWLDYIPQGYEIFFDLFMHTSPTQSSYLFFFFLVYNVYINKFDFVWEFCILFIYRLLTAYLLLWVNYDKIMHMHWDFDASSAQTRRVSALDKHQNWRASTLFCHNSRPQSKYVVI